jgi:glycyl-tRNA synthetase beta chain
MPNDLLFEIGTEEIPARFMPGAIAQLKELAAAGLKEQRLDYEQINVYATPRRLALVVGGLAEKQRDLAEEVKGPPAKAAFDAAGRPRGGRGVCPPPGLGRERTGAAGYARRSYVYASGPGRPAVRTGCRSFYRL